MVEFVEKLRKEEHVLECMGTGLTVETTEPATEQVIVNYLKVSTAFFKCVFMILCPSKHAGSS